MASVQSILVIFGEVDRLVVDNPDRTDDVATVLGAYSDRSTPGWYEKFTQWLSDSEIQRVTAALPFVDDALTALADDPPTGRAQARLLLAIAALGRANPERVDDPERRADMARAVEPLVPEEAPPGVEIPDRAGRADGLVQLLANMGQYEGIFETLSSWERMLRDAYDRGFISESLALQIVPPCQAGYVELPGATGPIASLKTEFVTAQTFESVSAFLEPARWPDCTDLWCSMGVESAGPPRRYLEVIGFDCDNPFGWRLRTYLEFEHRRLEGCGIAVADYRLATEQAGADQLVEVDEGSIVVIDEGSQARIVTVKRLRFRGLALQAGMAALMCALGYASVGEEMVYSCALTGARGTPLDAGAATTIRPDHLVGGLASELVDLTVACVNENTAAMTASVSAAARGQYTLEHLARDVSRMWLRPLQDINRLSKLWLDLYGDVSQPIRGDREAVSLPVTFEYLPVLCTFRLNGGRLSGPFGRTLPAVAVALDPASAGPVQRQAVSVKATVSAEMSGAFVGWVDAVDPAGVPAAPARPVVLVVP